jgi:hypothetical protein
MLTVVGAGCLPSCEARVGYMSGSEAGEEAWYIQGDGAL